jgi:UDP-N-acetylmuramate--alanine ligase
MFRKSDTHIHFVGIGGIGMSGIAELLLSLGYRVTGTDLVESDTTRRLAGLGATVHRGHRAEHVSDADVVVISSAVGPGNPEVTSARARRIPVIPRAEMLAELMRLKQGIAVAGSHGKTTTTSLIASVLQGAGIDPTVVIGGKLNSLGSNARLGNGEVLVAEADESDGSFLMLSPMVGVITNIDREHLDYYGEMDALLDAFVGFANRVPFYGQAVLCRDDPNVAHIMPRLTKRVVTYGLQPGADYVATDIRPDGPTMRFVLEARGESFAGFSLRMPGVHNVLNALAAIAVADQQQVPVDSVRAALAEFDGVQRRFTVRGEVGDVVVVDDYGHHPTEIRATLAGARTGFGGRRIVGVVQPHRYSRLRDNLTGFVGCLDEADVVVLTDIYAAGESPIGGVTIDRLFELLCVRRRDRTVVLERSVDRLAVRIADLARAGDLVITLGAGSITRIGDALVQCLAARSR